MFVMRLESRTRIAEAEARAEATRAAALAQGLSRFPPNGGGALAPDRYEWPPRFAWEEIQALRLAGA